MEVLMADSLTQYYALMELVDARGSTFWEEKKEKEMAALKPWSELY